MKLSDEERQSRTTEYLNGQSTYQIAAKRSVTATSIWLYLKKCGTQLRERGEAVKVHYGSGRFEFNSSTHKYCYRCKEVKPISEFYRSRDKEDGRMDECKECSGIYKKKWYWKNVAIARARLKAFRENYPDKSSKYSRDYRHTLKGRMSAVSSSERRRAALLSCKINDLMTKQVENMIRKAKICPVCREAFDQSFKKRKTLDHGMPLSKGGNHTLSNVRIICQSCNSKKGNREVNRKLLRVST